MFCPCGTQAHVYWPCGPRAHIGFGLECRRHIAFSGTAPRFRPCPAFRALPGVFWPRQACLQASPAGFIARQATSHAPRATSRKPRAARDSALPTKPRHSAITARSPSRLAIASATGTIESVRVAILGALEVHDDGGRVVAVAGARLRALIARLALAGGQPVSTTALAEAVWDYAPPSGTGGRRPARARASPSLTW